MSNYLTTSNPHDLQPPPTWWLQKLKDFDSALVLFPSVMRQCYVLARRRGLSNRPTLQKLVALNNDLLRITAGTDGDVIANNNLVYVDSIVSWGAWNDNIFKSLRGRDTWAVGGGEAYADLLDAGEAATEAQRHKTLGNELEHRAMDAWHSLQARTGQRNRHARNSGLRVKQTTSSSTASGIVIPG